MTGGSGPVFAAIDPVTQSAHRGRETLEPVPQQEDHRPEQRKANQGQKAEAGEGVGNGVGQGGACAEVGETA